jgi:hypothetical protein
MRSRPKSCNSWNLANFARGGTCRDIDTGNHVVCFARNANPREGFGTSPIGSIEPFVAIDVDDCNGSI